ncbi:hypothetical protein IE877_01215 [Methylomonas sp. EbA]|uniref:Transposase n=1 Tax=Methylomonas albis TaxID=1854563 RepID=A0ABR9CUQ3_9GAMM|nr:hypothetical protein [Methylomonas albis]
MNKDNAKDWDSASVLNDALTDLLKKSARALSQQAVEAELQAFLGEYAKVTDIRGRQTLVRNGYLPESGKFQASCRLNIKFYAAILSGFTTSWGELFWVSA